MPSAIRRIAAPAATSRSAWPPIWAKELPAADAPDAAEEADDPKDPRLDVVPESLPERAEMPPEIVSIPLTALPPTDRTGPAAAARRPILTMKLCVSGDSLPQASARVFTTSATVLRTSVSAGPMATTSSAPIVFSWFMIVVNWSIGSRVPSKVSETDPSKSPRPDVNVARSRVPFFTAL